MVQHERNKKNPWVQRMIQRRVQEENLKESDGRAGLLECLFECPGFRMKACGHGPAFGQQLLGSFWPGTIASGYLQDLMSVSFFLSDYLAYFSRKRG